jgi:hypothetical protein
MKKYLPAFFAISLFLAGAAQALAQATPATPGGPAKVLQIFREEVKVGKGAAHEKFEAGSFVQAFAKADWPTHYLAMTTITGPSEAWFLTPYDSFEAWEKDRQATEKAPGLLGQLDQLGEKDAEFLTNGRSIVAIYRPELSYRREGVNIFTMRYISVTTYRVRPGHNADFEELRKIANEAHEKANVDEHWSMYQVISGMPGGTFLYFQPHKSLKEEDAVPEKHGKAYQDALGDEGRKKLRELSSAAILTSETTLFAFSPKMSYVSKEAIAADPDFWAPKPKTAARKPAGATETAGARPAAPSKKPVAEAQAKKP